MADCCSQLIAQLSGLGCEGKEECFWCGSPASEPFKPSSMFTAHDLVHDHRSRFVCAGCLIATDEKAVLAGKEKLQKRRNYSWLVTGKAMVPYGKGDIGPLRKICLDPPSEPWCLAIAVSGQKTILYRAPVNVVRPICAVLLEEQIVHFEPSQLGAVLDQAEPIVRHIGRPALKGGRCLKVYQSLYTTSGREQADQAFSWYDNANDPLYLLAAHLAPTKKELTNARYVRHE